MTTGIILNAITSAPDVYLLRLLQIWIRFPTRGSTSSHHRTIQRISDPHGGVHRPVKKVAVVPCRTDPEHADKVVTVSCVRIARHLQPAIIQRRLQRVPALPRISGVISRTGIRTAFRPSCTGTCSRIASGSGRSAVPSGPSIFRRLIAPGASAGLGSVFDNSYFIKEESSLRSLLTFKFNLCRSSSSCNSYCIFRPSSF